MSRLLRRAASQKEAPRGSGSNLGVEGSSGSLAKKPLRLIQSMRPLDEEGYGEDDLEV